MITIKQYFGAKPHTNEHVLAAEDLLERVDRLKADAVAAGKFTPEIDPDTGTEISGSKGGAGDGGFRLPTATTGTQNSSHKEAKGVDHYDPNNEFDHWLDEFEGENGANSKLEEYSLYREHPDSTPGWCHLTTRKPGSGRRTFHP